MHDFDFLFGAWTIRNRRLRERLKGSTDWEEFQADYNCRPILHGLGNIDQFRTNWNGHDFEGLSLRIFNPETQKWSIYWVDNFNPVLQEPLVGAFKGDIGEFYCDDTFEGKPLLAKFIWTKIDEKNARWEQAFSPDNGESWETNWIMEFRKTE